MPLVNMEERYTGKMIHYLESTNMYVKCEKGALNITSDALNLADFVKEKLKNISLKGEVLDIGAGIGSLTFLLINQANFTKFSCIEIQEHVYEILKENIQLNKLDNAYAYLGDILAFKGSFEYIVSNPPFYKTNSGLMPADETLKISKFEVKLTLDELLEKSYDLLKDEGYFFLILDKVRHKDILKNKYFQIVDMKENVQSKKTFISYMMKKK